MGKQFAFFALYEKLTKITGVIGEISLLKDDCLGGPTVNDWKDTEDLENLNGQLDVLLAEEQLTPVIDGPLRLVHQAVVAIKRWLEAEDWLKDADASDERLEQSVALLEKGWHEIDEFIHQMARIAFGYWGAEFFSMLEHDERGEIICQIMARPDVQDLGPLLNADDVPDEPVDVPPQMVWSPLQLRILKALSGRALKKEDLAREACGSSDHGNLLYRGRGIKELMKLGIVENTTGVGYWRTDSPPMDKLELLFPWDFGRRQTNSSRSSGVTATPSDDDPLPY